LQYSVQLRFNLRFVNNAAIATGGALIRLVDISYTSLEADVADGEKSVL